MKITDKFLTIIESAPAINCFPTVSIEFAAMLGVSASFLHQVVIHQVVIVRISLIDADCLIQAAFHGLTEVARSLLTDQRLNADIRNEHGQTPLMWSARRQQIGVAAMLLAAGANINAVDNSGNDRLTALSHFSCNILFVLMQGLRLYITRVHCNIKIWCDF